MSSDDEDTWRHKRDESQRRRDRMRPPTPQTDPIPVMLEVIEEITAPIDLLDGDLTDSQLDLVRRSRRNSGDHATVADLAKIYDRQDKKERSDQVTNREVKKLLGRLETAEAVEVRLAAVEKTIAWLDKWGTKIGVTLGSLVLGSAGYLITKVQDRAELQGETTIRLKHIEDAIGRLIDHEERRYPFSPAPIMAPSTKDKL